MCIRDRYEAALEAKEQGKIRHIGITNHRIAVAKEAVLSGLYETLQFPFSYLASEEEKELVKLCKETNTGFIAMKGLAGGLIHNSALAYAFMCQPEYSHVEPIWGVQREWALDEFLSYQDKSPKLTEEVKTERQKDKDQRAGEFCRGCGYCMPCPAGIETVAYTHLMLVKKSYSKTKSKLQVNHTCSVKEVLFYR